MSLAPTRSEWIEMPLPSGKRHNRRCLAPRGASGLKLSSFLCNRSSPRWSALHIASGLKSFRRFVNCPAPCLFRGWQGTSYPPQSTFPFLHQKRESQTASPVRLSLSYFFLRGWFCPLCPPCPADFPLAAGRPPGCLDAGCLGGAGRSLRGGRGCLGVGSRISMG